MDLQLVFRWFKSFNRSKNSFPTYYFFSDFEFWKTRTVSLALSRLGFSWLKATLDHRKRNMSFFCQSWFLPFHFIHYLLQFFSIQHCSVSFVPLGSIPFGQKKTQGPAPNGLSVLISRFASSVQHVTGGVELNTPRKGRASNRIVERRWQLAKCSRNYSICSLGCISFTYGYIHISLNTIIIKKRVWHLKIFYGGEHEGESVHIRLTGSKIDPGGHLIMKGSPDTHVMKEFPQ